MLCKTAILVLWLILLIIYAFAANFLPRSVVRSCKKRSELLDSENRKSGECTLLLGTIEIFAYSLSILLNYAFFIGVWFGVKTLNRWPPREESPKHAAKINIFLTGNLLAVLMGVFGGLFFKCLLKSFGIDDSFIFTK